MTGPINLPVFGLLMHAIELVHDRGGWGGRPSVWVIARAGIKDTLREMWCGLPQVKAACSEGGFVAQLILNLDLVPNISTSELLGNFARNMATMAASPTRHGDDFATTVAVLSDPDVYGFAVCAEERANGGECRTVYAADRSSRIHMVQRLFGQDPTRDMSTPLRDEYTHSLLLLVDVINGNQPKPAVYAQRYPRHFPRRGTR